ncbi:nitroreductase family protein, partial [Chryseobacterium sp. Marseille-Q8038]
MRSFFQKWICPTHSWHTLNLFYHSAPTSFRLQNWRFIAVRTPEAKARLLPIAWQQPAI